MKIGGIQRMNVNHEVAATLAINCLGPFFFFFFLFCTRPYDNPENHFCLLASFCKYFPMQELLQGGNPFLTRIEHGPIICDIMFASNSTLCRRNCCIDVDSIHGTACGTKFI